VDELALFIETRLKPARYVCCEEHHQDGGTHYHAYIEYDKRIDRTIASQWDFNGQHPNIQHKTTDTARENAFYYCTKEADFRCSEQWECGYESVAPATTSSKPRLEDGLNASTSLLQFMQWAIDNDVPIGAIAPVWGASKSNAETITDDTEIVGENLSPELQLRTYESTTRRTVVVI